MAIPTFTSISQNTGFTIGNDVVYIEGTNFRVAPLGENPHSVSVKFGGFEAKRVEVMSDTSLIVWTPAFDGQTWNNDKGATSNLPLGVNIEITNLDDYGIPIPTENIIVSGQWEYDIRHYDTHNSGLDLIVAEVISRLKKYWLNETYLYKNKAYSSPSVNQVLTKVDDTGAIVTIQEIVESDALFVEGKEVTDGIQKFRTSIEETYNITFRINFWTKTPQVLLRLKTFLLYEFKKSCPYFQIDNVLYQWNFTSLSNITTNNEEYPQDEVVLTIYRIPITDPDKIKEDVINTINTITINTRRLV